MEKDSKKKKSMVIIIVSMLCLTVLLSTTNLIVEKAGATENWYNDSWAYRSMLRVDDQYIDADLTNFPILVRIDDNATIFSQCQPDLDDLIFISYADNTTQFAHEIDTYSVAGDVVNATIWVNLSNVYSGHDTRFWMYWGNAGASNSEDTTGVWDSDYLGVYHMNASTTQTEACYDSTSNTNHGTFVGDLPTTDSTAKVGEGQDLDGDNDYISLPSGVDFPDNVWGTVEAWAELDSVGSDCCIYMLDYNEANEYYALRSEDSDSKWFSDGVDNEAHQWELDSTDVATTSFTYICNGMATDDVDHWINDNIDVTDSSCTTPDGTFTLARIGVNENGAHDFDGTIDEFRLSKIKRSDAWIDASYNSVAQDNFIIWGSSQMGSDTSISLSFTDDNGKFTFQEELGNTSWANESGSVLETAEFNITHNSTDLDYIRINCTDIDTNITASNISFQFSSDGTTWGSDVLALDDGANTIWLNTTKWAENYCYGDDPFPIDSTSSIYWRCKITVPSGIGNETYSKLDYTWDAGYYS